MGWSKLSALSVALSSILSAIAGCSPGDAPGGAKAPLEHSAPGRPQTRVTSAPSRDAHSSDSTPPLDLDLSTSFRKVFEGPGAFLVHEDELYVHTDEFFFNATENALLTRCSFATGHWENGRKLYWLARMTSYSACPDNPILMKYEQGRLLPWRHINAHDLSITSYRGQDIALVVPHRAGPPWGYELISLNGGVSPPRPRQAASKTSADGSAHCYTELQNPFAFVGFDSGHLFVFGNFLCPEKQEENEADENPEEQATEEDRNTTEEPLQSVSVEYWMPGASQSRLVSFGFSEALAVAAAQKDALWILGQKTTDETGTTQSLFHFDGRGWSEVTLPSKKQVLSIAAATHSGKDAELWLLKQDRLVRAHDGHSVRLPEECKSPLWFRVHSQAVWLSCEEGVFSTDDQVEVRLTLPEDASCALLDVRPERPIPSLWGKGTSGGCGARSKEHEREPLFQ